MGTRAAAFAGKISNLRESLMRIQNGTLPQPTCLDLANMLKYFCQVLHDFRDFKDIENVPLYASEKKDRMQLIRTLPNFDYCGLYTALTQLVDVLHLIPQSSNGFDVLGTNLLMLFKCLVLFLDQANMETMPLLVTTLFRSLPQSLYKDILDTLCYNILPFTIDQQQRNSTNLLQNQNQNQQQRKQQENKATNKSSTHRPAKQNGGGSRSRRRRQHRRQLKAKIESQTGDNKPHHCIVRIEDDAVCDSGSDQQIKRPLGKQVSLERTNSLSTGTKSLKTKSKGDDDDQGIVLGCDDEQDDTGQTEATAIASTEPTKTRLGDSLSSLSSSSASSSASSSSTSGQSDDYAMLSVTSILMIAFHYINEPMHNSQLIECLMKLKNNVFEDLLFVIAYGTTRARCPAVELLFRYWPDICPTQQDRKSSNQGSKLKHIPWQPTKCQNRNCSFTTLDDDEAVKMCLDFKISITLSDLPPPMLVCLDCVDSIYKQQLAQQPQTQHLSDSGKPIKQQQPVNAIYEYGNKFLDLLLPMERVSRLCENKKCKSTDRSAIGTCFDIECANYNGKRPIRYCKTCFVSIHEPCEANNYDVTLQNHIRHSSISLTVMSNEESINNFVEAIISLLKEAAPADKPSKDSERYLRALGPMHFSSESKDINSIATEEKQLTSQYGIWLMTGLSESGDKLSDELLGRLLGMLFQWFHFTACLPDDQAGSALEKLKGECIKGWLMDVKAKRMEVFISCLLPHPIDCSKIGGHWEVWPDTAYQIKEGFKRLLCLVPYDIITNDVWDEIMPYWMECFRHEVPEEELSELKILLSKVFDPELSPLGFETKQMYNFISSRFADPTNTNQEQTLYWLQIITMLEIPIPIDFLFQMFHSGVRSLAEMRRQELSRLRAAASRLAADSTSQQQQSTQLAERQSTKRMQKSPANSSGESGADQARGSHFAPTQTSTDQKVGSPNPSLSASCGAISEDDVMLPARSQPADGQPKQRPLTLQERQARARAAFSAKLMQQASILDAQHSQSTGSQGSVANAQVNLPIQSAISSSVSTPQVGSAESASTTSSTVVAVGAAATCAQLPASGDQSAARPMPKSSSLAPMMSHTHPLRSVTVDSNGSYGTNALLQAGNQMDEYSNVDDETVAANRAVTANLDSTSESAGSQAAAATATVAATKQPQAQQLQINKIDNNLLCYILMLDILLQQLNLQEINSHRGLDGREAQQAIDLLNTIISTPWIGRHTCYTDSSDSMTGGSTSTYENSAAKTGSSASASSLTPTGSNKRNQQPHQEPNLYRSAGPKSLSHCVQGFERQDEASSETCVYCEMISFFHQLAMSLIEYFSLVIEVSICEITQDAANSEFDGKPDYSRIGLDHLGPSPKEEPKVDDEEQKFSFSPQQTQQQQARISDPILSPFTPHYCGPTLRREVLETLPKELQLTYNLLVQFHQYQTPDIVSQLLQMIKLISLHAQVLSKASKSNPQFISWCQHNMLINKLWTLCQDESSEIARTCVPLLMHCITLPWGVRLFRDLVERDFNSDDWLSRFGAVERVVTIAYFCEPATIKNSTLLQSTMASAFCYVVRCLDDIEAIVAQRALVSLEMMKTSSLKLLLWCLEVQFDCIIIDRPIILRAVFQLYNHLRDRRFLTWEFFLNRFDTIFLEAQIYLQQTGEIPSFTMQDLKNTNTKSEIYQKKIIRAKEALQETHLSRSLASRLNEKDLERMQQTDVGGGGDYKESLRLQRELDRKLVCGAGGSNHVSELEKRVSPLRRVLQHGTSLSSRYQSVAFLTSQSLAKRENSKFMSNLAMQSVPLMLPDKLHQHLPNSFVDDGSKLNEIAQENHVFGVVHRVCDEDRDTNHSLIFLLMQFFSKPDPSHPQTVKTLNRSHQIVLRHLNILMGYSIARKNFLITAANLRLLPVFNAFLTSLPKVLDFNYSLGTILLDTCLPVLVYCPAQDDVQYDTLRRPTYSLWLLNPLMRQSWLLSVMTFLYKYQFGQLHLQEQVYRLMWIVINTLESHLSCSAIESTSNAAVDRCMIGVQQQQQQHAKDAPPAATSGGGGGGKQADPQQQQQQQPASRATGDSCQIDLSSAPEAPSPAATMGPRAPPKSAPYETAGESSGRKIDSHSQRVQSSEAIEMLPMKNAAHAQMHASNSSGSVAAMAGKEPIIGSAADSSKIRSATTQSASAIVAAGRHQLVKADTSESLGLKSRLFQRSRPPTESENATATIGSSSSSTMTKPAPTATPSKQPATGSSRADDQADAGAAVAALAAEQQTPGGGCSLGDERLLPIGLHHRRNQSSDERLLPIGSASQLPSSAQAQTSAERVRTRAVSGAQVPGASEQVSDSAPPTTTARADIGSPEVAAKSPSSSLASKQTTPKTTAAEAATDKSRLVAGASAPAKDSPAQAYPCTTTAAPTPAQAPSANDVNASAATTSTAPAGRSGKHSAAAAAATSGAPTPTNKSAGKAHARHSGGGGGSNRLPRAPSDPSNYSNATAAILNEQLEQLNRHAIIKEFSDKDLSMCLVILETFIHHEPSMAASMLPNILRLVARYSSATSSSSADGSGWQSGATSNAQHVGGSMFVARQFIRVALHDLMENKIFHQIFTSHFTGHDFYKSMATALADFPDLNQLAPLSKLFEDLNKQKNLPQASSLMTILENVATYFECIIADSATYSQTTWNNFIVNWENFLRKLILALPRYTGATLIPNASSSAVAASATAATSGPSAQVSSGTASAAASVAASAAAAVGSVASATAAAVGSATASGSKLVGTPMAHATVSGPANNAAANVSGPLGSPLHASAVVGPAVGASGAVLAAGGGAGADANQSTVAGAAVGQTAGPTASSSPGGNIFFSQNRSTSGQQDASALNLSGQAAASATPSACSLIMAPIMRIILSTSRISHLASCKTIVDPYSKIISYTVLNSQFKYEHLLEINHNCCRLYTRDREKYLIQRTIAYELVQVLKFRFFILEENLLLLLLFILQDVGGTLAPKVVADGLKIDKTTLNHADSYVTNVSDCLRQHIGDFLEFITDVHAISRMHENLIGPQPPLINRDSFGGHVKAAISQYLALEMSLATVGDNRTVLRYLPWLYASPSLHQGPREFIDCVSHIRQLSWIILGSLQHSALMRLDQQTSTSGSSPVPAAASSSSSSSSSSASHCQPIPIEKNSNVAEHVQVILAGFAEQSKESVLHMSGLFHAFLLCQLWTMYCGNICLQHAPNSEQYQFCQSTLDDFWAKVTPGVLRLVSHSRVMSEMVSTHFLQLIESLIESNSSVLIRYLPMWNSVFYSYKRRNKSGNIAIRLQKCIEWQPPDLSEPETEQNNKRFLSWLEKVQYKMSHIEIQSSQAAPFYLT